MLDTWHCMYSLKQMLPLCCVPYKVIQQETVHLAVNIFNGNLEAVECPCFCQLHI